jgi:hypothetical protein
MKTALPLLQRLNPKSSTKPAGLPACACALVVLCCLRADAQTWDGGDASNYWTNALNWVGDVVPDQDSAILFNNAAAPNLNNFLGETFYVKSLTFGPAQTTSVTINSTDGTNAALIFHPGTIVTVNAGSHTIVGPAPAPGAFGGIIFYNEDLPVLDVAQVGNVITLSWPAASAHYRLQAQTNGLISGGWSDYPGGGSSPVNVTIDPANPAVFYRLVSSGIFYTFDVAAGASLELAGRLRQAGSAGTRNYYKTGGGSLFLSKDNGGNSGWLAPGDTFTVNQGILRMGHRARGNSGMKLVANSGGTLQVDGEEAMPNGSVSLAGAGVYGTNGALEFVGGLNISGGGTNRIEAFTVNLTSDTSIGALQSGQLNKCGLSGAFTMTKVGPGELELGSALYTTNANPWAGIIVSNGTLKVSGAITYSTPVTVATGATLRVTASFGSVGGPVTVQTGGKVEGTGTINGAVSVDGELAPGVGSAIPGTLTINNSLTLGAGSTTSVQVAAASNDQVASLTSVVFGGTLNVTDISLGGITPGQTFQLFSMGGSGSFTVTGTPSIGGTWSFNPATGVLAHIP